MSLVCLCALLQEFPHACLFHLNALWFKVTAQLLYHLLHELGVSFLSFPPDGTFVWGTIELTAGTNELPEPEPSPVGLSTA